MTPGRVNFYNVNDYALAPSSWEFNQIKKPDERPFVRFDFSDGPTLTLIDAYYSYGPSVSDPNEESFIAAVSGDNPHDLSMDIRSQSYEIMSFAAEARGKALGASSQVAGFAPMSLQTVWPDDTAEPNPLLKYGSHKWHSAQVRSTNMRQQGYWRQLLISFGLTSQ